MSGRLGRKVYASARWKRLRLAILDEACWKCAECGAFADEVHHVRKLADGGSAFGCDNLLPICRRCHLTLHQHQGNTTLANKKRDRRKWLQYLGRPND